MAEEVEHTIDSPTEADGDVMLDEESENDDDQESEEIADETVNAPKENIYHSSSSKSLGFGG